ncbi:MAG: sulfur oxidation c-type cytochrome SoxX, partial [Gammaproteobacteria bacterium]|nr:sulfur oxidation c-type cytochrome SoxX [Gammaproteobacteria bacterium]
MKKEIKSLFKTGSLLAVVTLTVAFGSTSVMAASAADEGKKISFSKKKGNCLACHMMGDGLSPGNIAPPLVAIKARFTKEKLRAQILDATVSNSESPM